MTAPVATRLGRDNIFVEAQMLQSLMSRFVPLQAPLTSVNFDGDSFSTTAKTLIDLSTVFGAPAGIKAISVLVAVRDAASAGTDAYLVLGPTNVATVGMSFSPYGRANDTWDRGSAIVACDVRGDIYYQILASAAGTFDVVIQIYGYFI